MVSKKSILEARKGIREWRKQNPKASLGAHLKRNAQYIKDAYEMDIKIGAIPSMLVPMPERAVKKLQRVIKKY